MLFARDSVDVQFGGRAQRGLFISSPHGVSQASSPGAVGPKVPHCHAWEQFWLQAAASMFLLQACFPLQQVSLDFFVYMVAQKLPLLKVCNSEPHFCLPHSVPLGQARLGGARDTTHSMYYGDGETYRRPTLQIIYHKPITGNHSNIKEIKRKKRPELSVFCQ